MKSKKVKYYSFLSIAAFVAIGINVFLSCQNNYTETEIFNNINDNVVETKQIKSTEVEPDYELIGKLHNEGLDYFFEYLKEKKNETRLELMKQRNSLYVESIDVLRALAKKDISDFLYESMSAFLKQPHISKQLNNQNYVFSKEELTSHIPFIRTVDKKTGEQIVYVNQKMPLMSNEQKHLYAKLMSITNNQQLTKDDAIKEFEKLEKESKNTFRGDEKIAILGALSVAKHSMQYWNQNITKWKTEFGSIDASVKTQPEYILMGGGTGETSGDISSGDIINADAGGALVGALYGGGVGSLPGWLAGAIGTSAAVGIGYVAQQLWEWLTGLFSGNNDYQPESCNCSGDPGACSCSCSICTYYACGYMDGDGAPIGGK